MVAARGGMLVFAENGGLNVYGIWKERRKVRTFALSKEGTSAHTSIRRQQSLTNTFH